MDGRCKLELQASWTAHKIIVDEEEPLGQLKPARETVEGVQKLDPDFVATSSPDLRPWELRTWQTAEIIDLFCKF